MTMIKVYCQRCGLGYDFDHPTTICCPDCGSPSWQRERMEAVRAHYLVNKALKHGTLVKQPCSVCGTEKRIEGHHPDYAKPLDKFGWIANDLDVSGYPGKWKVAHEWADKAERRGSFQWWMKLRQTFLELGGGYIHERKS